MQTTGACQVGTSSAGSQRCLRSCTQAVVRPCSCTSCCTGLTLTRQGNSVRPHPRGLPGPGSTVRWSSRMTRCLEKFDTLCHTIVMYTMLAATKTIETFNADYYIAIVTILPILMVAIEVLTKFNQSIPNSISQNWPTSLGLAIGGLYLFCPIIAASGVVVGVLALKYRDAGTVDQWITFSCLIIVIAFLAISSSIYLYLFDSADTERQKKEAAAKGTSGSGGSTR
jgi:hypothetical protein